MQPLRRKFLCGTGLIACNVVVGCAAPTNPTPPPRDQAAAPPIPKVGEYWEYAVRDAYVGFSRGIYRYVVSAADLQRFVVDVVRDGVHIDTYSYAVGWNPIEQPLTNLQRFRYEPAFPAYEFPLYPGKAWRRIVRATDAVSGKTYSVHVHSRVGEWANIRVPAGQFATLRVTRYVYAGNGEFFKLQEEITQTDWYAPALGYVVMSDATSSHIDTSRSGGGRGRPLRVRGDWLISELTGYSDHPAL